MRDHLVLGSTSLAAGLPIPPEANTARDSILTFFTSNPVRFDVQLSTIQQGDRPESWDQWN